MPIPQERLAELAVFYRRHLIEDVAAFWEARTADAEGPGYLVAFDRRGELTGTDKNMWCQGRQTYTFAALYEHLERRPAWLALAERGRDLLAVLGEAGGGRWPYLLDRGGRVIDGTPSLLTDAFALMGLCQYATASGSDADLPLIRRAFDAFEANLRTPTCNEYHHFKCDPSCMWLGARMVALGMAESLRPVLGEQRIRPLMDQCLHEALHVFARDEHRLIFEMLGADGSVLETPLGRRLNPGHALECMWFCAEEGLARGDRRVVERAIEVMGWAYENGHDREHGGLLAFTTPEGAPAPAEGGASNWSGESPTTKIWWAHSEALYATALAALWGEDRQMWTRFEHLHAYTQRHFADPEFGEWYTYLDRDGTPRVTDKGTWIRCAFHVPRNLMKVALLLERAAGEPHRAEVDAAR